MNDPPVHPDDWPEAVQRALKLIDTLTTHNKNLTRIAAEAIEHARDLGNKADELIERNKALEDQIRLYRQAILPQ